jgi:IS5 family transposase
MEGTRHGFTCFVTGGRVGFWFADDEQYFHNQFLVSGTTTPTSMPTTAITELVDAVETITRSLELVDGLMHVQCIQTAVGPRIVELCRRCPGDLYPWFVQLSTGYDYAGAVLRSELALQRDPDGATATPQCITRHCLMGECEGTLRRVELDDDQQRLVGLLALIAGQDVEEGDQPGSWRIARKVAQERVISTVDPETRHMHKSRSNYRDGFKAHLAVEPDTGLITGVDLTAANAPDGVHGVALLEGEPAGLDVLADSAYGTGPARASLDSAGHRAIIKPWPLARNPRLGDDQFHRDDFTIDHIGRTVTCPNGHTVPIPPKGTADFGSRCNSCPLRSRCTSSATG